jgi:CelD/BcsL family acetyltransferase involved in cellulose biosynthesis
MVPNNIAPKRIGKTPVGTGDTDASDSDNGWSTFVIRDLDAFAALKDEWNELTETRTIPFARHEWFFSAYEEFYSGKKPYIVGVRQNGRLVSICPLIEERLGPVKICEIIGVGPIAEWGCVPVDDLKAFEPLIDAIVGVRHAVILQRLRHDMPGQTTLNNALSLIKPVQIRRTASPAHNLPFVNDWRGFYASLSSSRRKQLRRKRRQAENLGTVVFRIVSPEPGAVDAPFDEFAAVEHASWKGEAGVSLNTSPKVRRFFRKIAETFAGLGALRFFFLDIDGRPAAAQFALEYGNRLWGLKIGYDQAMGKVSPGLLLDEEVFRYCHESRIASYEFLGKADAPETFWNPEIRSFVNLHIYPKTLHGLVEFAVLLGESRWRWLRRKLDAAAEGIKAALGNQ